MNLIPRAQWTTRPPLAITPMPGVVEGVALHWEGIPSNEAHDRCDDSVRAIQRYHMNTKRWADIAYNFIVCEHGSVFEGRGWGVRSAANGTDRANDRFHAVCFLGGEGDPFTSAAKAAIVDVVGEARRRYPQGLAVRPHSHFRATVCPGSVIRAWLVTDPFMPVVTPPAPPNPQPQQEDDMFLAWDPDAAWLVYPADTPCGLMRRPVNGPGEARAWEAARQGGQVIVAPMFLSGIPEAA